jgi:hypothetical protein
MNKLLTLFILTSMLSACNPPGKEDSPSSPFASTPVAIEQCESVPTSNPVVSHDCPGNHLTWSRYDVRKDSSQTVLSVEMWCNLTGFDLPGNQDQYDNYFVPSGYSSGHDLQKADNCVSGSSALPSGEKIISIWQFQN